MSTITFDPERLTEFQGQTAQRPWAKRTGKLNAAILIASVVPAVVTLVLLAVTDLPTLVVFTLYLFVQMAASGVAALATKGTRGIGDSIIIVNAIGASIFSLVMLVSLVFSVIVNGLRAISPAFLFQNNEYISPSTPLGWGGIGHAVIGTVLIVAISALIAVPLGVMTALYVTEVRGRAVPYVRFFVQAMSGVPSVVAGLFILTVFILTGVITQSAFAGGLAYAILMLPTVARTAEEVLRLVPEDLRTGALALGSTRARVVLQVVLPAAKTGIITAMILGIARVVGETAPLLLTALKNDKTILNPFSDPISALPTYIFENVAQPYPDAVSRAWGAALVLLVLVAVLFTVTRLLSSRRTGK